MEQVNEAGDGVVVTHYVSRRRDAFALVRAADELGLGVRLWTRQRLLDQDDSSFSSEQEWVVEILGTAPLVNDEGEEIPEPGLD